MTTPLKPKPYRRQLVRERKPSRTFILQDRDISIIQTVQENRLATAPILARFFPPDPTARKRKTDQPVPTDAPYSNLYRRLANLFHNGYLYRFRTVYGGEHIYALDSKGMHLLKEHQLSLPLPEKEDWRPSKERTHATLFVDHTLMVARFRASLQHAVNEHNDYELIDFQREGLPLKAEWKRNNKRVYVNPDAFFILKDKRTNIYIPYFLEADRSTMQLSRLMHKYKNYSLMYQDRIHTDTFGIETFGVLTVCKSNERATNALTIAADESAPIPPNLKRIFYFTTEAVYADQPANMLAAVWRRADDIEKPRAIISAPLPRKTT